MALPRSGISICQAQFHCLLQTDDPRTGLGNHPAPADYGGVHDCLRSFGQVAHRWRAAFFVLYVRKCRLGIFCWMPDCHWFDFYPKCRYFRQGLFSPPNHADFNGDVATDLIRHPVPVLPGISGVLFVPEQNSLSDPFDMAAAIFTAADGYAGARLRYHCLVADDQIPRLDHVGILRDTTVDVCDPSCLSSDDGAGKVADPVQAESNGSNYRGIP